MDQESRASDLDRDATVGRLQQAFAEGRLAPDEMEQRVERALSAVSHGDLATLLADLPERPGEVVTISSGGGKIKRTGKWRAPRVLRVESNYGGAHLDLTEAVIEYPEITLDLHLTYGAATIILPPGASAEADGVTFGWGALTSQVVGAPRPGLLHVRVIGELGYGRLRLRYGNPHKRRWFKRLAQ